MAEALDRWVTPILLHVREDDLPGPIREAKPVNINEFNHYLEQLALRSDEKE